MLSPAWNRTTRPEVQQPATSSAISHPGTLLNPRGLSAGSEGVNPSPSHSGRKRSLCLDLLTVPSFDLCSLPRESLSEQVPCQAGWEQLVLCSLLPTPQAVAGASGPLRTSYMQAGDRERALRHLSGGWGAILVRITFLSSLSSRELGWSLFGPCLGPQVLRKFMDSTMNGLEKKLRNCSFYCPLKHFLP